MIHPNDRQKQAIRGLFDASPEFFCEYLKYLEDSRNHEREALEKCPSELNELYKGKCTLLSEQINLLASLVPKVGS